MEKWLSSRFPGEREIQLEENIHGKHRRPQECESSPGRSLNVIAQPTHDPQLDSCQGVERERDGGEELSRQNTGPVLLDKEAIVGWLKGCAVLGPQVRRSEWRKQAEEGITVCVQNSLSSAATTLATFR